jgi:intracellular sulfur oxidation DsrE/DsrF family protein
MQDHHSTSHLARRSFLTHVGAGATLLGAAVATTAQAGAEPQASGETRFQPARHPQDAWLDQIPGKHRLVFDTTSADGANWGATFANNFFTANASGYGLKDSDLAVIIVMRHNSTAFAYSEAIWAKYGESISKLIDFVDPNTKVAPKTNVYGRQLDGLIKRGMHLAVCQMATRRYAGTIGQAVGKTADQIYDEIAGSLLPNANMVPAGIVALSRAQEYGYSVVTPA